MFFLNYSTTFLVEVKFMLMSSMAKTSSFFLLCLPNYVYFFLLSLASLNLGLNLFSYSSENYFL